MFRRSFGIIRCAAPVVGTSTTAQACPTAVPAAAEAPAATEATTNGNGKASKKGLPVGTVIPDSKIFFGVPPTPISTDDLFRNKRVLMFAVPGAFTAKCSAQVPDYVKNAEQLKTKYNVSEILCVATNDSFVMDAWGKQLLPNEADQQVVKMGADPMQSLLKNLNYKIELPALGGKRYARVSLVIDDAKIEKVWEEADGKGYEETKPENLLK